MSGRAVALLVASAILLAFAVSELATLRGSKAHVGTPDFLAKALGPSMPARALARRPAHDVRVTFGPRSGFTVARRAAGQLTLTTNGAGTSTWTSFANGVSRPTPFGHETVTVGPGATEQYLTVTHRQGVRTWSWDIGTGLQPVAKPNGSVDFYTRGRGTPTFQLLPVSILDASSKDITPAGLAWKLKNVHGSWRLSLRLDDSKLPVPYVIDPPIVFDVASSAGNNASNTITWNHTVANQPNRMLIVSYNAENTGTSSCQPTSVTYNGVAMTLVAQTVATAVSPNWDCVGMYYLLNPANGTHAVTVTFASNPVNDSISAGAISIYSVAQNPPDATNTSQAAGLTSTSVTTLWPNSWVIDALGSGDLSGNMAASAGQTQRLVKDSTGSNSLGMSTKLLATAGSTTMSWTRSPAPNRTAQIVAAFSPLDNTAPSAPTITPSESSPFSFVSGTTLYYNAQGSNSGSFTVDATSTDVDSGIKKINFPAIAGMVGGGDDFTSPYQGTYNWTAATSATGAQTVTVTNGQNLTSTGTFTLVNDTTAPAGGALTVNGTAASGVGTQSYNNTGNFTIGTRTDYTEAQTATASGLASSTLTRAFANYSAPDTCGSYNAPITIVGAPAQNGLATGCYLYTLTGLDNVGNSVSLSTTVKVDTSAPSTPTLAFSNLTNAYFNSGTSTLYVRPAAGGTIKVTASSTDSDSGVKSGNAGYTFLTMNSNGGANFVETQTGNVMDYTFGATATVPTTPRTVSATNNAGLTSANASYTVLSDTTAPTVVAPSVTAGYYTSLSVPVTVNTGSATDGGSGVNAASSILQRDVATLANGACGAFSGSWTTITLAGGNDTGVTSGHCYEYRELLSDNVGNQGTSPVSNIAKIDTGAPTNSLSLNTISPAGSAFKSGNTIYYRGSAVGGGSFKISNAVSDPDSGPGSSTTAALGGTSTGWSHTPSTVNAPAGGPYVSNTFSWSQGTSSSPTEVVTGADAAGNTTAAAALTFTNDSTAPTVVAPSVTAGYYTSLSVPVTVNTGSATDGGSGVDNTSSILQRDVANLVNGACGAFSGTWTTIALVGGNDTGVTSGHCYEYRQLLSDNVGNQGTSPVSNIAKVDTAGPSNSITVTNTSPAGSAFKSGNTIYYRGSAVGGGSFKLTNAVSDAESGPASSTTAALGGTSTGWSHTPSTVNAPAGGPYVSNTFSWSQGTSSSPTEVVTGADAAGNTTAAATLTFTNDSTAPTVIAPSVTAGYYASLSVAVTMNTGSATDGGSGVDNTTSILQRDVATLTNGSCGAFSGTWTTVTLVGGNDTGVTSGNCYEYRELLSDNVGNQGTSPVSNIAKIDTAAPSNSITVTNTSPAGSGFKSGTTVYYRGSAVGGGSLKLTNAVSDAASGPASSTTAALGGTSTGWSHTPSTVNTPAGGPYASNTFSWSQGTSSSPTEVVTGADAAGNTTASATLTFTNDSTAPTMNIPTVTAGYYTSLSVPVTPNGGTDAGSGVDNTTSIVQRDVANLANGACGAFSGSWTTVTLIGGNDTGVTSGHCYEYRELLSDNVGNQGASAASNIAKVDTAAPSNSITVTNTSPAGSAFKSGNTIYYRGSAVGGGSFKLTNAVSDAESGPASSTTAGLGGTSTGWSHTPSTVNTPAGGPYASNTFSWSQGTSSSPTEVVTGADAAGNTTAAPTLTFTNDSTAPTMNTPTVTAGYYTSLSVPVTPNGGTDAGSGVDNTTSIVQRDVANLANGVCGAFSGSWTTITLTGGNDTGVTSGHCYEYRELLSDNVGNQGTSPVSNIAKIDTAAPSNSITVTSISPAGSVLKSGSTIYYRGSAVGGGSFKLTNAVSDAESGPASSTTAALGGTSTGWSHTPSTVNTPAGGPYDSNTFSWSQGTSSSPTEVVTGADAAGNTTAAPTLTFTNDSSAPTGGALTVNGTVASGGGTSSYSTTGSFPIDLRTDYSETQSATASGLASSTLTRAAATLANNACGSYGAPTTIAGAPAQSLGTGCYLYTLTGVDNVGNSVSLSTTVIVDTTAPSAPTLAYANVNGSVFTSGMTAWFNPAASGGFDVTASSSDADSGISGYTFPTAAAMGTSWSASGSGAARTYSFTPGASQPGTKSVTATNNAGATASSSFTVTADSTAPTTTIQCNAAACLNGSYYTSSPVHVTLSANDGSGSGVRVIRYTLDGSTPTLLNGSDYLGTIDVSTTTTINFRAYDNVGNAEAVGSQTVLLDSSPPTGPTLTLTENPATGAQFVSGTTLYYRPGASGTFRVSAATSDPETGVASVTFPSIANVTGGGSVTSAPYQSDYTWNASTTDASSHSVVSTNNSGMSSNASFTLTQDSTAPAGQSITLTGAGAPYYGSASVTFSLGDGSDGGSGLDTSSRTVTRESAPLAGDTCGTFTADAGTYTSPDTAVSGGHCYRYSFTIADNVGNVSTAVTATAKVDTAGPSVSITAPTAGSGAASQYYDSASKTQFFRPSSSGSFTLNASASDSETAVTGVTFPDVSGVAGWSGSTGGTDTTSPYSSPATYSWSSGAAQPGAVNVTAADKAGNSGSDTITLKSDGSAPSGQTITLTGANPPWFTSTSVTFSLADGTDNAGGSGVDTSSRTVTRETAPLTNGSCGTFTADAGTYTSPDTAVSSGNCYRYTFVESDRVGNVSAPVTATAKIDATSPAASVSAPTPLTGAGNQHYDAPSQTLWFRPAGSGSFSMAATASDAESGIAQVAFPDVSAVSGWSGSTGGIDTTSPYTSPTSYAWTSGATAPGARTIVATNGSGLTGSATITLAADSTAPSGQAITLSGASAPYYGSASVSFSLTDGSDAQSGLDTTSRTVTRESAALSGDTCGAFAADPGTYTSPDASVSGGHCYRYTFTIADNVGNASAPVSATARVDTAAPTVSVTAPSAQTGAGNQYYDGATKTLFFRSTGSGSFTLNATASDTDTAVTGVAFPDVSGTSGWSGSTGGTDTTSPYSSPAAYSWTSGAGQPGSQNVVATDKAGNTASDAIVLKDDSTAPSGQTITLNGATAPYYGSASVAFSLADGTDNVGGSGVDVTSRTVTRETGTLANDTCSGFTADPGTFTSPDTSVSGGHCYRYTFVESDRVGNQSGGATAIAKVDTSNPVVSLTDPGSPLSGTVALAATASDAETAVTQVVFQSAPAGTSTWTTIGTDTTAPYSASWDTTSLSDGLYDLRAIATNSTGATATSLVASRRVDNTPPNTTIDSQPPNPDNDQTPTFAFSSSESGSTFACRIDGGSWTACSSPYTLASLAAGSHTFDVRATDQAGNTDPTPATYTWTIDLTVPNTTIDVSPPDPSNNANPTFQFSSDQPGSTFQCRIDGGSWTVCSSPDTLGTLTAGSHTFDVRARNSAGSLDPSPASYTWVIDLTAPTVTITAPTTYINAGDPTNYTVTASTPDSDVARIDFFECSNASTGCSTGTWNQFGTDNTAPYSAIWTAPAFDGPKAIRAVAVDTAGNTGAFVRTITIDRTAPTGVSISYPNGYVTGAVTITTGNGPDGDVNASTGVIQRQTATLSNGTCGAFGGFSPVTSPDTVASGNCAIYRYQVADNAGNVATATNGNVVESDTAAPTSTIADPGANLRGTITLSATANDTGGSGITSVDFQRRLSSGGSWTTIASDPTAPYSTSFDTTTVADGLYDFRSVATDAAGNVEAAPVPVTGRRIDNTPPSATMSSPGNPVRGTVTLSSTTSDAGSGIASVTYEIAPHNGAFSSQAASWDTTGVADGLYDLRVVATDVAGNTTTSALITTRVDNTPPSLTFSSPATGAIVTGTVNLTASATDASPASPPVSFEYKLHSAPPSAYAPAAAAWDTSSVSDGLYDLRATASDDAGNSTQVVNTSIRVDNTPPTVSITAPPAAINGSVPSPTPFSANANDTGSGVAQVDFFECSNTSIDCTTGTWNSLGTDTTAPYSVNWNIPSNGNHALQAVATDNAGHTASATRNVVIDTTPPVTAITGKPADPSNAPATFTFTSNEAGSTFECQIDGNAWAPCTSPKTYSGLADNTHTFAVRATDPAGNVDPNPDSWTWHRDTTAPTGTLNDPGRNVRGTVTLTSSGNDPVSNGYASGIASVAYEYSANGTTWASIGTLTSPPFGTINWTTNGITDGVYQLHVIVTDLAGNSTTSSAVTNVRIDNTPPTTSQNDPGPYLRGTKTLSASAADAGSGIDHVDFEIAPAGSGSWTTIGTATTSPYSTAFDTTGVADGAYDFRTIAFDVAGNQAASAPVTNRLVDNTPPSATMTNPGPYVRGTISLSSTTSDPGGANASGIASAAYEYSTDGGSTWTPTGASLDTKTLLDGNLQLHVVATDNAGNSTTSGPVTTLVDNTKPVTTDDAPSGWQSSPVTVNLTASDAGSGVNVTQYSVDGGAFTVGTSVTIPAPSDGSNDGTHTIAYFSADNAGNIEQVRSTQVLINAKPPACPSCTAADYLRGTVTLSASPSAGPSGIQSVTFQYSPHGANTWTTVGTDTTGPAPYTTSWDTTAVADGHYDLRIIVTDNANNSTTTDLPDKVVDNTPPNVATVGSPTQGATVSGNLNISASAADATSPIASVAFFVNGSSIGTDTSAPYSLGWNSASVPDGSVQIYVVVTDMAGNSTQSPVRTITVDNNSPSPTLANPGQNLSGTVTLTATSDPDTVQANFEVRPAGGSTWTSISTDTTSPWAAALDTTTLSDGLYDFRVVATDGSGNTGTSPIRSNVRIDNTPPTGSLTAPAAGATVGGSAVTLSVSASDGGSGVASVRYEERPTGSGSFSPITTSTSSPFGGTWDTTGLTSGDYDLRPVITDAAGNTFTGAVVTVHVDASAPTVVLANTGSPLSGTVTLNATVTGSGATQVVFSFSPAGANAWQTIGTDPTAPYSASFDTTKLSDGTYDLRAVVSDSVGNTSSSVRNNIVIDNFPPSVVSSTPADGSHVTSASSIALVVSEPATPVNVMLDGAPTVAPVVNGTQITYGTGALGNGLHTLSGTLRDATGKTAPFLVSFTVWNGQGTPPPTQGGSGSCSRSTTVTSADGFATVTLPGGACSSTGDWLVITITPISAATQWNGFLPGTETVDVTAHWALSGIAVHHFLQPVQILLRASGNQLVPATRDSGDWHVLTKVPVPGILPGGWQDGQSVDSVGAHILTLHLSQFTMLKDVQAPAPPSNVRGFLFNGGLTLSWVPGPDNSGTFDYVSVLANGTSLGNFGNDRTGGDVGPFSPTDPRGITLSETDLSGNVSVPTALLRPVPSLVGLSQSAAEAALADAGFTVGTITQGDGPAGTVTGPGNLVLAEPGAAIDLTVGNGSSGATKFVFGVVTAKGLRPTKQRFLGVRVKLTRKAQVTAVMSSPRRTKLYTWTRTLKAGYSILKLPLPRPVRRPGSYTISWTARAGTDVATQNIRVRFVRRRGRIFPRRPLDVVLAGTALPKGLPLRVWRVRPRVVTTIDVDPAFDLAGARNRNVSVMVVQVDQFGVQFVRDLHTVFPNMRIVALSHDQATRRAARRAGASATLGSSATTSRICGVVRKLLKR